MKQVVLLTACQAIPASQPTTTPLPRPPMFAPTPIVDCRIASLKADGNVNVHNCDGTGEMQITKLSATLPRVYRIKCFPGRRMENISFFNRSMKGNQVMLTRYFIE